MTAQVPRSRRILELDALRGIAALAVLVFHYTVILPRFFPGAAEPAFRFAYGYYGVHLFFMISGFVIFMTIENCVRGRDFVVSRFARLYPAFWTAVILTFAIGSIFPLADQRYSFGQLIVNLTMLHEYAKVASIDGVYWSLTYELGFYFAIFVVYKLHLLNRIEWICLLWASASALFQHYAAYIPHPVHFLTLLNDYAHLFAMGIMFHRIRSVGFSPLRALVITLGLVAEYHQNGVIGLAIVAGFAAIFALLIANRLGILRLPLFAFFGAISYSLYLIHQLIGFRIIEALQQHGMASTPSLALTALLIVALASAMTFGVERPAMRFIRRAYRESRFAKPAAIAD